MRATAPPGTRETIRRLAYTDPVTDLPNRVRFHEQVQPAVAASVRDGRAMALLLMDLERFKEVNDTLGHKHGDQLLRQVGQRLRAALFSPDTVARLGGDEFGILLPRLARAGDIAIVCKKSWRCWRSRLWSRTYRSRSKPASAWRSPPGTPTTPTT